MLFDLFSDLDGHQWWHRPPTHIPHLGISKIKVGRESAHSPVFRIIDISFFVPINTLTRAGQGQSRFVIIQNLSGEKSTDSLSLKSSFNGGHFYSSFFRLSCLYFLSSSVRSSTLSSSSLIRAFASSNSKIAVLSLFPKSSIISR